MRNLQRTAATTLAILGMVVGSLAFSGEPARADSHQTIHASLGQPFVSGLGWTPGELVSMSVDGADPVSLAASEIGGVSFPTDPVVAGTEITMSQSGGATKTLIVADITASIDLDAHSVAGTTDFAGELLGILLDGSSCQGTASADVDGLWSMTFTAPGGGPCELTFETPIQLRATDADGDQTLLQPRVPRVSVSLGGSNVVVGYDWPANTELEVSIGSEPPFAVTTSQFGSWFTDPLDNDIVPGDQIEATDGSTVKTLVVSGISPGFVDPETDTVSGAAEEGLLIRGTASVTGDCYQRDHVVDASGQWTLDWSVPDPFLGTTCDLTHDTAVMVMAIDHDGDDTSTSAGFPKITVHPSFVSGSYWPEGASVDVSVNGESVGTVTSGLGASFGLAVPDGIQPGDVVVATDGTSTKTLELAGLGNPAANYTTNAISGTTTPDAAVEIRINASTESCDPVMVPVLTDGAGAFEAPIPNDPSWGCQLEPGIEIWVNVLDSDADRSQHSFVTTQAPSGGAPGGSAPPEESPVAECTPTTPFEDLDGLGAETVAAIGCLADLGIALGTGDTTFDPHADVDRWQMALFLIRLLETLQVEVPEASDHGFTDVAVLPAETRDAINRLAAMGIATGTSSTKFGVEGELTRWQMALFLSRVANLVGLEPADATPTTFTDIADLPPATRSAIDHLAALDVTKGTGPGTFDPSGTVSRWQMALFLTRMLTVGQAAG